MNVQLETAVPLEIDYTAAASEFKNTAIASLFRQILAYQENLEKQIEENKQVLKGRCYSRPFVKTGLKVITAVTTASTFAGMLYVTLNIQSSWSASMLAPTIAIPTLTLITGFIINQKCYEGEKDLTKKINTLENESAKPMMNLLVEFDQVEDPKRRSELIREAPDKWTACKKSSIFFEEIFHTLQPFLPEEDKINKHIKSIQTNGDAYKKSWRKLDSEINTKLNYIRVERNCFSRPENYLKMIDEHHQHVATLNSGFSIFTG
jgi:hypothetical protein